MNDEQLKDVFVAYQSDIARTLRRYGVPSSDVDDARQEVFLVVHRKVARFEGRSTLRTWLCGICRKVASDFRRRGATRREVLSDELPVVAVEPDAHRVVAWREAWQSVHRVLSDLPEGPRTAVVLYELEGKSMAEVAHQTGVPVQTAYARLYSGRARFRALLTASDGALEDT